MAYQNVGTPRFYVSILQWLKSLGLASDGGVYGFNLSKPSLSLLDINPSSMITLSTNEDTTGNNDYVRFDVSPLYGIMPNSRNFYMVLGHNFASATVWQFTTRDANTQSPVCGQELINKPNESVINGFSIMIGNDGDELTDNTIHFNFNGSPNETGASSYAKDIKIGSLLYGTYYDMPNAPDLSLTMSRKYNRKELTTKKGNTISNQTWNKPSMWGIVGAWELYTHEQSTYPEHLLARSGRRTWDLKFSYVDDGDLWGSNQMLSDYFEVGTTGYDIGDIVANYGANINFGNDATWLDAASKFNIDTVVSTTYGNTGWTSTGGSIAGSGYELHITGDGSSDAVNVTKTLTGLTAGYPFRYSVDIRRGTSSNTDGHIQVFGSGLDISVDFSSTGGLTESMQTYSVDFIAPAASVTLFITKLVADSATYIADNAIVLPHNPDTFENNLLTDDNFFSQVWHKTLGGTLPFIFQPDNSNNNPDSFAICRLKDSSLKAVQSAFHTYDVSLKIEEVW